MNTYKCLKAHRHRGHLVQQDISKKWPIVIVEEQRLSIIILGERRKKGEEEQSLKIQRGPRDLLDAGYP